MFRTYGIDIYTQIKLIINLHELWSEIFCVMVLKISLLTAFLQYFANIIGLNACKKSGFCSVFIYTYVAISIHESI